MEGPDTAYLDAGAFDLTGTLVAVTPDRDERGRYTWEGDGRLFGPNATLEDTHDVTLHVMDMAELGAFSIVDAP